MPLTQLSGQRVRREQRGKASAHVRRQRAGGKRSGSSSFARARRQTRNRLESMVPKAPPECDPVTRQVADKKSGGPKPAAQSEEQ